MLRLATPIHLAALTWAGVTFAETPLSLNAGDVGALGSNKAGELALPRGGPRPIPP